MTDQQKLLLELTKTVQLQTKLLETQIKQCISSSSPLITTSTTSCTTSTELKHPASAGPASTVSISINPQKGESSITSSVDPMNPNGSESVSSDHQNIKRKVNKPMDTAQYEFVTSSERSVLPAVKISSSKMLDLSVDSGIVPEMPSSCNKHMVEEEEEEETFLDKDGNVTTRKIECAKTVAKVESWLKGILTPPDAGNKVKDKKVTFVEPSNSVSCNSDSQDECLDEIEDTGEGKVDSTTELNALDHDSDSDSEEEKFVHEDNATFTRGSGNLPYPFPTSCNQDIGIKALEPFINTSPSVESSKEISEPASTKAAIPCLVRKQFPCPINWQTFLRPTSGLPLRSSIGHGSIPVTVYSGLPQSLTQTRLPVNFQPPMPVGFQPPLPPEDEPPPPPPPPDHSPEEEIKQKDRNRKSSKKKSKKKKQVARLEFSLQMNDPVGKVILEMSRHKLQQEQINGEYSIPLQFTSPASTPCTQITPPFLPHSSPEINEIMPQQITTSVPCLMSSPQFGPVNRICQPSAGLLIPSYVPNGLQQPNTDLMAPNRIQQPNTILMATNRMQQPYIEPIVPNKMQQPNTRQMATNRIQQPNTNFVVPNKIQQPNNDLMVPNKMQQPNNDLIIPNILQEPTIRHMVPNQMQQPNTNLMIPNRIQQPNTHLMVPNIMQQPKTRQMVPNRMQQPKARPLIPNQVIQNRMPQPMPNGMQHPRHALGSVHNPNRMKNQNISQMVPPETFPWQTDVAEMEHISSNPIANQTDHRVCGDTIKERLMHKAGYGYNRKRPVLALQEGNPEEYSNRKADKIVWSPQQFQGKSQKFDSSKEHNFQNVTSGKRGKKRQKKQNEVFGNRKRVNPHWNNLSGCPRDPECLSSWKEQMHPRRNNKTKEIPSLLDVNLAHMTSGMDDDFLSTKENRMSIDHMSLDEDLQCFFADQNFVGEAFDFHMKSQSEMLSNEQDGSGKLKKNCVSLSCDDVEREINRPVQVDKNNCSRQPAPPGVDDWN